MTQTAQASVQEPGNPDDYPVAIVNGVPTDKFGRAFLNRPSEFIAAVEAQRQAMKRQAVENEKRRREEAESEEEEWGDPDESAELRKIKEELRTELRNLQEDTWIAENHERWLTTWQDGRYMARGIRELNERIAELVAYKRHLIERYFDREATATTHDKILVGRVRMKELKTLLKPKKKASKPKALAGLSDEQIKILLNAGMTIEQLMALAK